MTSNLALRMYSSSSGYPAASSTVAQHHGLESLQDALLVASQCTDNKGWPTENPDVTLQRLVDF